MTRFPKEMTENGAKLLSWMQENNSSNTHIASKPGGHSPPVAREPKPNRNRNSKSNKPQSAQRIICCVPDLHSAPFVFFSAGVQYYTQGCVNNYLCQISSQTAAAW